MVMPLSHTQERLAWKFSATLITGGPALITALAWFSHTSKVQFAKPTILGNVLEAVKTFAGFTAIVLMIVYFFARIVLLILPCVALRALPAAVFIEVQWASFFPHVG